MLAGNNGRGGFEFAGGVADLEEAGEAAGFGFIAIHGQGAVAEAAGVGDVVLATTEGAPGPGIDKVKGERGLHRDTRVQGFRRCPGPETHGGDEFALGAGGLEGHGVTVTGDAVSGVNQAGNLDLDALHAAVHITGRAGGGVLLAEDVPGFEGLTDFQFDAPVGDAAADGEAEFQMGGEPFIVHGITIFAEVLQNIAEVLSNEVREHEPVVQTGAPADEFLMVRRFPKAGDQGAEDELLGQTHAGVRRHFKCPQFQ